MNNQLIATGISRSGTFALYTFYRNMGINAYHQRHRRHPEHTHFFNYSRGERWVVPYNLDNPLEDAVKAVEAMTMPIDMPENGEFMVSTWAASEAMYLISRKFPMIQWLIIMRDISGVANSLRRYVWKPYRVSQVDIDYIGFLYLNVYNFILKQARRMEPKPYFVSFSDMVNNRKSEELLSLMGRKYGLKEEATAKRVWGKKHNTLGEYLVSPLSMEIVVMANKLENDLKEVCRCL